MSKKSNKKYYSSNNTNFIPPKKQQKQDTKKPIFWVLFFLIIFWTVASFLGSLSFFGVNCSTDIPIAMAYSSDNDSLEPYNYPNYNLLKKTYIANQNWTANGVTCSVNSDYSLSFSGVSTLNYYIYISLGRYNSSIFPVGRYYQQGSVSDKISIYTEYFTDTGNYVSSALWGNGFINLTYSNYSYVQVYLMVNPLADVNGLTSYPAINKSDVVIPYSPPIDVIYDIGVENGNSNAELYSNYFYNASFVFSGHKTANDYTYNVQPTDLIFGGVNLSNIPIGQDLSIYTKMSIEFNGQIPFENLFIGATGPREFFYRSNTDTPRTFYAEVVNFSDSTSIPARFTYNVDLQSYGLELSLGADVDYSYRIVKFSDIDITSLSLANNVIRSLTFYQSRTGYDFGYDDGYDDGKELGYDEGYKDGRDDGMKANVSEQVAAKEQEIYERGRKYGKIEGANEANDYSFLSLMTAVVDAPIQALSGLFGFDLLGVNLMTIISGLFTVCVIIVLLRLLLGGGLDG